MEVNGWLLILALFFTVAIAGLYILVMRIQVQLEFLNKTLLRLLGQPAPPQRSATVASRAQHRSAE